MSRQEQQYRKVNRAAAQALGGIARADRGIQHWVSGHRYPALTRTARLITRLGSTPAICVGSGLIMLGVSGKAPSRQTGLASASLLTVLGGLGVRRLCLLAIGRTRPPATGWLCHASGYSFPSGHSSNAAMASTLVIAALRQARLEPPGGWAVAAAVGCCYPAVIGSSRVYLGVHWPSDVVAGWALGVGWALVARRIVTRRAHPKRLVSEP